MSWIQSDLQYTETEPYTPPTWADGTDEEIIEALEKHYNDEIDLTEYWSVGDERIITLSAMSAMSPLDDSHASQSQVFVLMNIGGKELVEPINNHTECAFIVGQKGCLATTGYMNNDSSNFDGWNSCNRRIWCNTTYRNAFPSTIRSIFKQYKNTSNYIQWDSPNYTINTFDYFALPLVRELKNSSDNALTKESSYATQFEYYKTDSNINKGVTGYWTRSLTSNTTSSNQYVCYIYNGYSDYYYDLYTKMALSPFGVI